MKANCKCKRCKRSRRLDVVLTILLPILLGLIIIVAIWGFGWLDGYRRGKGTDVFCEELINTSDNNSVYYEVSPAECGFMFGRAIGLSVITLLVFVWLFKIYLKELIIKFKEGKLRWEK